MVQKLLITPVITPGGLPDEVDLEQNNLNGVIQVPGAEQTLRDVELKQGAPEHFHQACVRLLKIFSAKANAVLVGGTTGEGIGFGLRQWQVLMTAMKKACPADVRIMAGLLGRDDMIQNQIRIAHELRINEFVLGLNHTGDNQRRFDAALSMFGTVDKLWLYNMPTFDPASLDFVNRCAENMRVQGIKDSSKGTSSDRLRMLMGIKEGRPDFQVLAGNEEVYGNLLPEDFACTDGLVSGNSNVSPDALRAFTDRPQDYAQERALVHELTLQKSSYSGDSPATKIQRHIHGIKLMLQQQGILESQHVMIYNQRGKLFDTYAEPNE